MKSTEKHFQMFYFMCSPLWWLWHDCNHLPTMIAARNSTAVTLWVIRRNSQLSFKGSYALVPLAVKIRLCELSVVYRVHVLTLKRSLFRSYKFQGWTADGLDLVLKKRKTTMLKPGSTWPRWGGRSRRGSVKSSGRRSKQRWLRRRRRTIGSGGGPSLTFQPRPHYKNQSEE